MGRTPTIVDAMYFSVRLAKDDAKWLARQGNAALAVRNLIDDARNFYSLPEAIRTRLADDAKKHKKSEREYVIDLLTRRYEELVRGEVEGKGRR